MRLFLAGEPVGFLACPPNTRKDELKNTKARQALDPTRDVDHP